MKNKLSDLFKKITRSHFFEVLVLKWDAVMVSLVSIFYGSFLIIHPQLLDNTEVYDILSEIFTSQAFGIAFITLGMMKILSIVFNSRWLKIISISLLVGIWILFGTALLQNDAVNTIYIHSYGWAAISFGVVIREWIS